MCSFYNALTAKNLLLALCSWSSYNLWGSVSFISKTEVAEGLDRLIHMQYSERCSAGITVLINTAAGTGCPTTRQSSALQRGMELCIRGRRQVSDPFKFLRPCSWSSDALCVLFLPPPTPTLESLYFPLSAFSQFSDFRWRREKMACDLASFNRRANKKGR